MSDRCFVATRKGLFTLERSGTGWSIAQTSFLGDPVSMVLPDARDGSLYAALALGHFGVKLHRSSDGGSSWEECTTPTYPRQDGEEKQEGNESTEGGDTLVQIWSLEGAGSDQPDTLWAGTIPGGLFRSSDKGTSWELIGSLWDRPERKEWFGGGYDDPGIHSVCVDPRDSRTVTVGVSCGGVWMTVDGGDSWECRAQGMRAEYMPPERQNDCVIQDPHRVVQCPSAPDTFWAQHHNGVFRTTDGAKSWQELAAVKPSAFGFAVAVHPKDSDTAWLVPGVKDECRIPVNGEFVVTRTSDGGKSFDVLRQGLPQEHAYDLVYRHALDIDASGARLVMGSSTGSLWTTEDGGDSWQEISTHLPPVYCVRFG